MEGRKKAKWTHFETQAFLFSSASVHAWLQRCYCEACREREQVSTTERAAPAFEGLIFASVFLPVLLPLDPCSRPAAVRGVSTPLSTGTASSSRACCQSEVGTVSIRELKIESGLVCFPQQSIIPVKNEVACS